MWERAVNLIENGPTKDGVIACSALIDIEVYA